MNCRLRVWSAALLCLVLPILAGCGAKEEKKGEADRFETSESGAKTPGGQGADTVSVSGTGRNADAGPQAETGKSGSKKGAEKPIVATGGAEERAALENADLPDSARLEAAEKLLETDVDFLVGAYGRRDHARIVRALIEQRVAAGDAAVLPLLVGLFEAVGGEERIDFEQYILRFGRKAEGEMVRLLRAGDRSLVLRALDTLVKMKSAAAADSIALLLRHPEPWMRIGAAHAIGELGGPLAAGRLKMALGDSVYSVVNAALVGLGRLRGDRFALIEEILFSRGMLRGLHLTDANGGDRVQVISGITPPGRSRGQVWMLEGAGGP